MTMNESLDGGRCGLPQLKTKYLVLVLGGGRRGSRRADVFSIAKTWGDWVLSHGVLMLVRDFERPAACTVRWDDRERELIQEHRVGVVFQV